MCFFSLFLSFLSLYSPLYVSGEVLKSGEVLYSIEFTQAKLNGDWLQDDDLVVYKVDRSATIRSNLLTPPSPPTKGLEWLRIYEDWGFPQFFRSPTNACLSSYISSWTQLQPGLNSGFELKYALLALAYDDGSATGTFGKLKLLVSSSPPPSLLL